MIDDASPLVLGSLSPRRREILETLRLPFVVASAHIDEDVRVGETPDAYLSRIVRQKLVAVARIAPPRGRALLVADTVVIADEAILGKPRDAADAERMIASLSGREHEVATRFAISDLRAADRGAPLHEETVRTKVVFRELTEDEVRRYVATGEGVDKAGAYAIQGIGGFAVSRIVGSYPNVVGLPSCEVVVALKRLALLDAYPR